MTWSLNRPDSLILAVHAAFINFDQILFFGGDQHDPDLSAKGEFRATCLFDCNSFDVRPIDSPSFDAFCSGHALATGGRLVVAGGTSRFDHVVEGLHHPHFPGLRDAAVFTLATNGGLTPRWIKLARMNEGLPARLCQPGEDPEKDQCVTADHYGETGGRWYPTVLTLPNSNMLAISGHPRAGDMYHSNFIPEVFVPSPSAGGTWHRLGDFHNGGDVQTFLSNDVSFFPRLHVLPTGDVFCSTPIAGHTKSIVIDQAFWRARYKDICFFDAKGGDPHGLYSGYNATSVLLPLRHDQGYQPRILICGAERACILDLKGWDPSVPAVPGQFNWQLTNDRTIPDSPRRMNLNAVILPTGEIFISGGVAGRVSPTGELEPLDTTAVMEPEIFNPDTDTWEHLAKDPATVVRNYHSVALLMPDGRVWTAGSDKDAGRGYLPPSKGGAAEHAIEVYEPWYYGNPTRPQILALPDRILTGTQFVLETTQAANIVRVAMVRCGSCTHAFNPDQRYVTLNFAYQGGNFLLVDAAPNGNIAPPGLYFYYTINRDGLPSNGWTSYVSSAQETEAERMWGNLTD